MTNKEQWFVTRGKTVQGPFTSAQLKSVVDKGLLLPTDLVGKQNSQPVAASLVPGLFAKAKTATPPHVPGKPTDKIESTKSAVPIWKRPPWPAVGGSAFALVAGAFWRGTCWRCRLTRL